MGPGHLPSDKLQQTSEVQCPQAISQALPPGNGPHCGEDRVTVGGMGKGPQTAWRDLLRRPGVNTVEGRLGSAGESQRVCHRLIPSRRVTDPHFAPHRLAESLEREMRPIQTGVGKGGEGRALTTSAEAPGGSAAPSLSPPKAERPQSPLKGGRPAPSLRPLTP